jgi:hypothetical protein
MACPPSSSHAQISADLRLSNCQGSSLVATVPMGGAKARLRQAYVAAWTYGIQLIEI